MPRPHGQKLTKAEREESACKAYELSLKGDSTTEIAKALEVSRTTARRLVREETLKRRAERNADPVQQALDHYDAIIAAGWHFLSQLSNPYSYAGPAWLNSIRQAQERKDKILGTEAPQKYQVDRFNRYARVAEVLPDEVMEQVGELVEKIDAIIEPYVSLSEN